MTSDDREGEGIVNYIPGPWKVLKTTEWVRVCTDNGAPIQAVIAEMDRESIAVDRAAQEANAYLAAAAPDLLDAVIRIRESLACELRCFIEEDRPFAPRFSPGCSHEFEYRNLGMLIDRAMGITTSNEQDDAFRRAARTVIEVNGEGLEGLKDA